MPGSRHPPPSLLPLLQASALSLADCMRVEFRALTRLMAAGAGGGSAADFDATSIVAPFDSRKDELRLSARPAVRAERKAATEAAQARNVPGGAPKPRRGEHPEKAAWLADHTASLEEGYAPGLVGDMFRRRFSWFREPIADTDTAEPGQADYLPPVLAPGVPGVTTSEEKSFKEFSDEFYDASSTFIEGAPPGYSPPSSSALSPTAVLAELERLDLDELSERAGAMGLFK